MFDDLKAALRDDPVESLTRPLLAERFEELRRLKGAIAHYEARLVIATDRLDDKGVDGAGMLRSAGRMSSKAAKTSAKTAASLEELPKTAKALDEGRITVEHAAAVADAAEKTSPDLADDELIEQAEAAPADVFAKRSREWAGRNQKKDPGDAHARRRRNRRTEHWIGDDGMWMFLSALDEVDGAAVKARWDARCDALWRNDGGREGKPDEMRTSAQRGADAFVEMMTAAGTDTDSGSCDDSSAASSRAACGAPRHPKHALGVIYDIAGQTTADGRPLASLVIDGQPLPQAVLDRIACDSVITPMIFNGPGRPIWVGRDYRSATVAQWKALIVRDRGCVGCGAAPNRCEAHHILEWEHWGTTDIDNLVLACSRCHHDIHDRGMVLRRTKGQWRIDNRSGPPPVVDRDRESERQLQLTG